MASEIRVNQIQSRTGVSTISFTETGPIISGVTTITGDLDVTGLVSYDDVTNIDSVGVVTARSGVNVTGGSVGIGTDNPNHKLSLHQSGTGTFDAINFITGNTNANGYQMGINSSGEVFHWNTTNSSIQFATNNTERLRITSTGVINCGHGDAINLHSSTTTGINLNGNNNSGQIIANASDNRALIIGRQVSYGQVIEFFQGTNQYDAAISIPAANSFGIETAGTERLRIGSGGGHKITCAEGYYAANLTECNDGRIALNINQTRSGQTKAIAIGAISGNSATGIQCYDTSNNSANNLLLNPFGGNMGLGTNNPTSDGGTTFEIYDDNTPSIRLNDGDAYKALFQLRGNDLEIRGSNGQLEFYTGNADGASSSLRGAITSAGHKWTHNGSIFHGSSDVTDFTQSSRDTYNNVSLRAGSESAGTSPTNTNSAIKIYPAGVRSTTTGNLTGGITWQHLDPNNSDWGTRFGSGSQIWMGASLHDTPGQERDRFNLWMNDQIAQGSNPNNLAIEAYPNGMVRHPKVPAFMVRNSNNSNAFLANQIAGWNVTIFNNGSGFANGRFTAPVPGLYFFSCMMLSNASTRLFHDFRVNGTQVTGTRSETHAVANSYTTATITMIYSLNQNDYVEVYVANNNAYGGNYANFNGYLIG